MFIRDVYIRLGYHGHLEREDNVDTKLRAGLNNDDTLQLWARVLEIVGKIRVGQGMDVSFMKNKFLRDFLKFHDFAHALSAALSHQVKYWSGIYSTRNRVILPTRENKRKAIRDQLRATYLKFVRFDFNEANGVTATSWDPETNSSLVMTAQRMCDKHNRLKGITVDEKDYHTLNTRDAARKLDRVVAPKYRFDEMLRDVMSRGDLVAKDMNRILGEVRDAIVTRSAYVFIEREPVEDDFLPELEDDDPDEKNYEEVKRPYTDVSGMDLSMFTSTIIIEDDLITSVPDLISDLIEAGYTVGPSDRERLDDSYPDGLTREECVKELDIFRKVKGSTTSVVV